MTTVAAAGVRVVDEAALRGLLVQFDRRRDGSRLLVVTVPARWDGPETFQTEAGSVRVVAGVSVLAVRAAMAEHREALVVLTPLSLAELGDEVRARAWRQRAHRPSPWDAVKALFKVDQLDPSLRDERWMIDLLVQVAPARGYAQPTSQLLDRATAWRTLYRYGLGLAVDEPTTADLFDWAASPAAAAALARIDAACHEPIADHLGLVGGPAAVLLLRLAASGRGGDALALGLVVDALWPDCDPVARTLLSERHLGRRGLGDAAAADWGLAAVAAARRPRDDGGTWLRAVLDRADALLAEVDPDGTADSAVLDRSFPLRLGRLGVALAAVLDDGSPRLLPTAVGALAAVRSHLRSAREPGRVTRAEAALRLARRAVGSVGAADADRDLARLAGRYVDEGAWVDAARHRLAEGETVAGLVTVFERLLRAVDAERGARDRAFAAALAAEATAAPSGTPDLASARPLPIESVLSTVVAPVARLQPVLLLVIDGLSQATAIPLLADLRSEGWQPHGPGGAVLPPVIAALPTVTVVSRASLLSGRLASGGQDVERDGFAANRALLDAAAGQAPVLFHKSDLKPSGGEIARVVRDAVADPAQRVVGVVVNGVDDHLDKGAQLRLADGLEGVPVLAPLLQAAAEARRVVVVASDHGHILGSAQRVVAAPGGGERFRLPGAPPAADEVEVAGPRVLRGDHRVVAAAEDGVRYVAYAKHGYHGGATPAEALCPLLVLVSGGVELPGWEPLIARAPAWWDPEAAPVPIEVEAASTAPAQPSVSKSANSQLSLLDPVEEPPATRDASPAWLEALFASPRLADQRRLAGRVALDDRDLGVLLRVLVAAGGTVSGAALQRTLGLSASRLRGKLGAARTLLDVDGYQVLRLEADDTAALNLEQLARQFEITMP